MDQFPTSFIPMNYTTVKKQVMSALREKIVNAVTENTTYAIVCIGLTVNEGKVVKKIVDELCSLGWECDIGYVYDCTLEPTPKNLYINVTK